MSNNIGAAQLAITADASGVEAGVTRAKKSLSTLGGAARAAGNEAADGMSKIGAGSEQAAQTMDRETKKIALALQRTIAAADAGSRSTAQYFEALANQRGANLDVLRPMLQQLDAMATKQAAAAAAAKATAPAITQVGMSAAQTANALRMVGPQLTDIITQLQGGAAPLTVLIQQGGQLKDMFGGIAPAARALGGYVVSLISPLTLAAAAVATLGFAYLQGSKEGEDFARAIILSGNAAGVTSAELQGMAQRMAGVTGSQHAAADALAQFVANGSFAGDTIERFATLALRMERDTGQSVAETVKQFAQLGRSPVEAASKLNESVNFLTVSLARQIGMLQEQGRVAEAGALAQKAYADAVDNRLPQIEAKLGSVERGWRAVGTAAKWALDQIYGIGRPDTSDTLKEQLAKLEQKRTPSIFGGSTVMSPMDEARRKVLLQRIAAAEELEKFDRRSAQIRADESEAGKAQLAWDKQGLEVADKRAKAEDAIKAARESGLKSGKSQAEIDQRVAEIRKKFQDKSADSAAIRMIKTGTSLALEKIKAESEDLVRTVANQERRLDTFRSLGLLSDQEFYSQKADLIRKESAVEQAGLEKRIAILNAEKVKGADANERDKQAVALQEQLVKVRENATAKLEENSLRQQQATRSEAAAFLSARQAAQDYFEATGRRQNQEITGAGLGNKQREFDRSVFDINERADGQRRSLENQRAQQEIMGTFNDDERRKYDQRLQLVTDYQQRELAQWTDFNRRKVAAEGDWVNGAQEALKNYADQSTNVAAQVEQVFGNAFSSMEDALAQFIQTGKLSFSSLVRSILADIARMESRQAVGGLAKYASAALSGYMGGGGPGAGFGSDAELFGYVQTMDARPRAIGGPVSAGGMYQVNETGAPELLNVGGKQFLMTNGANGSIQPASAGGGAIHIVNNTQGRIDRVTEQVSSDGTRILAFEEFMSRSLADPNSKMSRAMKANFALQRPR